MDSCVENRERGGFPEDGSGPVRNDGSSLRAMIDLVYPLVRHGHTPMGVDISSDILLPAGQCGWSEQLELEKLCAVFSVVLDRVGNTVLTTIATYLNNCEPEQILAHFFGGMEKLANMIACAYGTSLIEAFRIGLTEGVDHEPF